MSSLTRAAHRRGLTVRPAAPEPETTHVVDSPTGQAYQFATQAVAQAKAATAQAEKTATLAGYALAVGLIALFVAAVAVISQWLI